MGSQSLPKSASHSLPFMLILFQWMYSVDTLRTFTFFSSYATEQLSRLNALQPDNKFPWNQFPLTPLTCALITTVRPIHKIFRGTDSRGNFSTFNQSARWRSEDLKYKVYPNNWDIGPYEAERTKQDCLITLGSILGLNVMNWENFFLLRSRTPCTFIIVSSLNKRQ